MGVMTTKNIFTKPETDYSAQPGSPASQAEPVGPSPDIAPPTPGPSPAPVPVPTPPSPGPKPVPSPGPIPLPVPPPTHAPFPPTATVAAPGSLAEVHSLLWEIRRMFHIGPVVDKLEAAIAILRSHL